MELLPFGVIFICLIMKYFVFLLFLFITINKTTAQYKHDYHWYFGYQNNAINDSIMGIDVNFNSHPVSVRPKMLPFEIFVSNITMSNEDGNLLFYTNGCQIANRNHEIMMNGDSINPGEVHDFICPRYSAGNQSCLVIPKGNDSDSYYLFHKGLIFESGFPVYTNQLYFSVINMSLDDGMGGVIEKNTSILEDTLRAGEMTAVKHINGEDWWLVNAKYNSSTQVYQKPKEAIKVYPNPTSGQITIDIPEMIAGKMNLQVFNALGQKVLEEQQFTDISKQTVDFSFLPTGIYLLTMKAENQPVFSKKIQLIR